MIDKEDDEKSEVSAVETSEVPETTPIEEEAV